MFNGSKEGHGQVLSGALKGAAKIALVSTLTLASGAVAEGHVHSPKKLLYTEAKLKPILADVDLLRAVGVEPRAIETTTQVGFAEITSEQEARLSQLAHEDGRCAGFESLTELQSAPGHLVLPHVFGQLKEQELKNRRFRPNTNLFNTAQMSAEIKSAIEEVSADRLRETVQMLSSYPNRDNRTPQGNDAVTAFKTKIEQTLNGASVPYTVELVKHTSTKQNSIRVRFPGAERPSEIIVMGAHIDSINQEWFGGKKDAPGADDNASGSANIFEAMRVLSRQKQAARTIEFMWYAGEESGLLGSKEIAQEYKSQNKDVIAVLQLDMTLFPGDGEFALGSMTDFTSAWLRSYLQSLNTLYINARIIDDKCGYGCSDHASWHRQGYPAIMPFEASFKKMNRNLHTTRDVIEPRLSFEHSAMFSKIAVAIGMDLGNSTLREPAQ